jgi:hypothetical protein
MHRLTSTALSQNLRIHRQINVSRTNKSLEKQRKIKSDVLQTTKTVYANPAVMFTCSLKSNRHIVRFLRSILLHFSSANILGMSASCNTFVTKNKRLQSTNHLYTLKRISIMKELSIPVRSVGFLLLCNTEGECL